MLVTQALVLFFSFCLVPNFYVKTRLQKKREDAETKTLMWEKGNSKIGYKNLKEPEKGKGGEERGES